MERGRRGTGSWLEFELAIDKSGPSNAALNSPTGGFREAARHKKAALTSSGPRCTRANARGTAGGQAAAPLRR